MNIITATYGKLGLKAKDVTKQLQEIVALQGGKSLHLKEGSKKYLFGEIKSKQRFLCVVYSDGDGITQRKTFKDEDAIHLTA